MTESARARLIDGFDVDAAKIDVIPHGATTPLTDAPTAAERPAHRAARLLTWGLLGPGKGIEWAIDAVAGLGRRATTPDVRRRRGDAPEGAARTAARRTGRCSIDPRLELGIARRTSPSTTRTATSPRSPS